MTMQYSADVKNAMLDAIEARIGQSPILKIFTGSMPANITDPDSGTVLVTITLPSDWMNPASGTQKTISGTWADLEADNTGTADYFRIYDSTGTTCHMQGTCGVDGSGADMILDSTSLIAGQYFRVLTFTLRA